MKNKFIVRLNFKTENNLTSNQVEQLLNEQWEQTAASMEGDEIDILSIDDITDTGEN